MPSVDPSLRCVCGRGPGQRGRACDAGRLQHGEGAFVALAEEPDPAAAGGRGHRVV